MVLGVSLASFDPILDPTLYTSATKKSGEQENMRIESNIRTSLINASFMSGLAYVSNLFFRSLLLTFRFGCLAAYTSNVLSKRHIIRKNPHSFSQIPFLGWLLILFLLHSVEIRSFR
jgi:hypothetical protein